MQSHGLKELFAPKGIRTLDLMESHRLQGPYHLGQPLGVPKYNYYLSPRLPIKKIKN